MPHSPLPPYLLPEVIAYNRLMADSFMRLTGLALVPGAGEMDDADMASRLFHAPQPIVSHGTEADPVFRYGNAKALELWAMDWDAFTRLPSRQSADDTPETQADRNRLLRLTLETGLADGYHGVRRARTGRRFEIRNTLLWNVTDDEGVRHGQAAFIREWRAL
ncbi:MAG: MEKHLA domain-containing protein [Asticcacaulis sp.]